MFSFESFTKLKRLEKIRVFFTLSISDVLATKFDSREMFKRLPFLDRLRAYEKEGIERFFVDKVLSSVIHLYYILYVTHVPAGS